MPAIRQSPQTQKTWTPYEDRFSRKREAKTESNQIFADAAIAAAFALVLDDANFSTVFALIAAGFTGEIVVCERDEKIADLMRKLAAGNKLLSHVSILQMDVYCFMTEGRFGGRAIDWRHWAVYLDLFNCLDIDRLPWTHFSDLAPPMVLQVTSSTRGHSRCPLKIPDNGRVRRRKICGASIYDQALGVAAHTFNHAMHLARIWSYGPAPTMVVYLLRRWDGLGRDPPPARHGLGNDAGASVIRTFR